MGSFLDTPITDKESDTGEVSTNVKQNIRIVSTQHSIKRSGKNNTQRKEPKKEKKNIVLLSTLNQKKKKILLGHKVCCKYWDTSN